MVDAVGGAGGARPDPTLLSFLRQAVLPVGAVPPHLLPDYAHLITSHTVVELASLRSFYREATKSPFRALPWSRGVLRLRFLPASSAGADPPLTALHMHRKVHAVVGIVHAPSYEGGLAAAANAFEAAARAGWPGAAVLRLFAFEADPVSAAAAAAASDASPSKGGSGALRLVSPFPPTDGDGESARAPRDALAGHAAVLMCELAAALLAELERFALSASPAAMDLATDADGGGAGCAPAPGDDDGARRRRYARLAKALGDAALLAGSPADAAAHYATGADLARGCGDGAWAAAALEGLAAANALSALAARPSADDAGATPRSSSGSGGPPASLGEVWAALRAVRAADAVAPLLAEARATARRRCGPALQVGFAARSARFLAQAGGAGSRAEVGALAAECAASAPAILCAADRLSALAEAADAAGLAGLARKRALLLWQAVDLCRAAASPDARVLAAARAALTPEGCGVAPNLTDLDPDQPAPGAGVPASWPLVRAGALEGALSASIAAGAHAAVWDAASALLTNHADLLTPTRQDVLGRTLDAAAAQMAPADRARPPGAGPPPRLAFVGAHPPAADARPRPLGDDGWPLPDGGGRAARADGPFIFSALGPDAKRGGGDPATPAAPSLFAAGDPVRVDVELSNPSAVAVQVERLTLEAELEVDGLRATTTTDASTPRLWRPAPVSLWLPPNTPPTVVTLAGTPGVAGALTVAGARVVAHGGVGWRAPFVARAPAGPATGLGLIPPRAPPPVVLRVTGALPRAALTLAARDTGAGPHPAAAAADEQPASPRDPGDAERDAEAGSGAPGAPPAAPLRLQAWHGQALTLDATVTVAPGSLPVAAARALAAAPAVGDRVRVPPPRAAVDDAALRAALPLGAGEAAPVTVVLVAMGGEGGSGAAATTAVDTTLVLRLEYRSGGPPAPTHGRVAERAVEVRVLPSLGVGGVRVADAFEEAGPSEGAGPPRFRPSLVVDVESLADVTLHAWLAPDADPGDAGAWAAARAGGAAAAAAVPPRGGASLAAPLARGLALHWRLDGPPGAEGVLPLPRGAVDAALERAPAAAAALAGKPRVALQPPEGTPWVQLAAPGGSVAPPLWAVRARVGARLLLTLTASASLPSTATVRLDAAAAAPEGSPAGGECAVVLAGAVRRAAPAARASLLPLRPGVARVSVAADGDGGDALACEPLYVAVE